MFGKRQDLSPARGGRILALSVLALLALCCAPVLAHASSAGYQYSDAPPTVTGGKPPSQSNLSGGSNSTSGIGKHAGSANSSGGKSSGGAGGSQSKSNGSAGESGSGQQGSQAGGNQKGSGNVGGAGSQSSPEPGSSGGGSSPLIPILIAIALLAGGSIAYVMIKRRRASDSDSADSPGPTDSSGSSVSPEAS